MDEQRGMPTWEEWKGMIRRYKELRKERALTKEEEEHLDFLQQKADDWASD